MIREGAPTWSQSPPPSTSNPTHRVPENGPWGPRGKKCTPLLSEKAFRRPVPPISRQMKNFHVKKGRKPLKHSEKPGLILSVTAEWEQTLGLAVKTPGSHNATPGFGLWLQLLTWLPVYGDPGR